MKRQREQAKRDKKAEKAARREERKNASPTDVDTDHSQSV